MYNNNNKNFVIYKLLHNSPCKQRFEANLSRDLEYKAVKSQKGYLMGKTV